MLPIARVGDIHACPLCGPNAILTGGKTLVDGMPIARLGDSTVCGATIVLASFTHNEGGMGIAYLGSLTSHGGVITTGSPMHKVSP
jgi:uncharacterized Zn-binding protein involved in type VI secretion